MPFEPSATRLWRTLDRDERERAALAFWSRPPEEAAATAASEIVQLLKIRPQAFAKLSPGERTRALARLVHPPESLADTLLVVFHLHERRELLAAFLDGLGVAHEEGLIDEDEDVAPVDAATARTALERLRPIHGAAAIRLYWNALWLQDRERWAGLAELADEI